MAKSRKWDIKIGQLEDQKRLEADSGVTCDVLMLTPKEVSGSLLCGCGFGIKMREGFVLV